MTEAGGSLQTEDAAQRQEETKRTQACQEEAEMEGDCYPNDRRTGTWRIIAEFFRRDSCLQAIAAGFILQGQILNPGPRSQIFHRHHYRHEHRIHSGPHRAGTPHCPGASTEPRP